MTAFATDPRPQPDADIWSPSIDGFTGVYGRLWMKLLHQYNEKEGISDTQNFRGVEKEAFEISKEKKQWSARHNRKKSINVTPHL